MIRQSIPIVVDSSDSSERAFDIYSLLLKERIVFLNGSINDQMASLVVAQLLYLNSQDQKMDINMYIQSPGGSVYAGFAIYDTMRAIKAPVATFALGFTGSMGTFLLSAGSKGKRYSLPHATIHMHPTGGGTKGYTEDVRIATREQERLQTQIFHIMGKNTGYTWEEIESTFQRDRFMDAEEARVFGLVDEVMGDDSNLIRLSGGPPSVKYFSGMN